MAETNGGEKPFDYELLTKTQRAYLWVGAFIAAFFQGFFCLIVGYVAHSLDHGG